MNYKCLLVFHLPLLKCLPSPGSRQSVSQWVSETNIRLEPPRHLCGIIWVINQLSKCSRIPFGHHDAPELLWRGCAFCLLLFLWRVAVCVYVCVRECLRESTLTGWDCNSPPPPLSREGAPKETPVLAEAQPARLSAVNPSLGSIRKNYEPSPEVCPSFLPRSLSFLWQNSCRRCRYLLPNDQQRYLHLTNSPTGPLLQMWYWQLCRRGCWGRQWDREPNIPWTLNARNITLWVGGLGGKCDCFCEHKSPHKPWVQVCFTSLTNINLSYFGYFFIMCPGRVISRRSIRTTSL